METEQLAPLTGQHVRLSHTHTPCRPGPPEARVGRRRGSAGPKAVLHLLFWTRGAAAPWPRAGRNVGAAAGGPGRSEARLGGRRRAMHTAEVSRAAAGAAVGSGGDGWGRRPGGPGGGGGLRPAPVSG